MIILTQCQHVVDKKAEFLYHYHAVLMSEILSMLTYLLLILFRFV